MLNSIAFRARRNLIACATTAIASMLTASVGLSTAAYAGGEIFDPTSSSCTKLNCSSILVGATVKSFGDVTAGRWVAEVFAGQGECLRLFVSQEFTDLETVVVAPNGSVYRNDDGGVGSGSDILRPLVKIDPTPNNGWYTVSIGHFAGAAVTGNFQLRYGRYSSGNINCANPTPSATPSQAATKRDGRALAPAEGEPGAE